MLTTLWDKIKAWFSTTAQTVEVALTADEQKLLLIVQPILGAGEASLMQDFITFIRGVLTAGASGLSLTEWEAAVRSALAGVGGELETLGKTLGSNLLQAIIGLLLTGLPSA